MATRESSRWPSKLSGDPLTRRVLLSQVFSAVLPAQKAELSAFDLSLLGDPAVPNELFFVREHFPQPKDLSSVWRLSLPGRDISLDELAAAPSIDLPVTLECAENPVGGGLVSHAVWTGVPVNSLLSPSQAGSFVRLTGADGFARTIPAEKALHKDTLLAYQMNGEKLPQKHGFPIRAIIPGWYGMDSVKWLRSIEFVPSEDSRQDYIRLKKSLLVGSTAAGTVTEIQVKSAFTRPQDAAILMSRRFTLRGVAWAGENRIQQVEVSTDGGKSWRLARIDVAPPFSWTLWSLDWQIPRAGEHELAVRAKDHKGRQQPFLRPSDRLDNYEWAAVQRIKVTAV